MIMRKPSSTKFKKDLSAEQLEELLRALKAHFEKNMNHHKGLEWAKVQAKMEANDEKLWSLNEKWKELAVNQMLLAMMKRRTNTLSMIVQRKVQAAAEMLETRRSPLCRPPLRPCLCVS
jgi:Protein of unknown function (DUF4256)